MHPGLPTAASVLKKLLDCQGGFFSFGVFQLPREETQHLSPAGLPRARAAGVGGRRLVSGPQSDAGLLPAASSLSLTLDLKPGFHGSQEPDCLREFSWCSKPKDAVNSLVY